jgi:hypothetical protein
MNDVSMAPSRATTKEVPFFELSRLMVVAVGSAGRLVYKAQTKPSGPWEANWSPIDTTPQTYGWMSAGITGDGRVAVVAQRAAGNAGVTYIVEAPDSIAVQRWSPPLDLGRPTGTANVSQPVLVADAGGRVEVFVLDVAGSDPGGARIWWKYQNPNRVVQKQVRVTPPGTRTPITITVDVTEPPATPWSAWVQLPGGLVSIQAKRNADGRVILFGVNSKGHIYRNEQKAAVALQPSDWAGWVQMDDAVTGTFGVYSATLDKLGAVNLFAVNQGGQVLHARQDPPCSLTWTGWSTPGFVRGGVRAVAAGLDGDGDVALVATDAGNIHSVNQQWSAETQQWTGWIAFNTSGEQPQLALDYNADGRLSLFSHPLQPSTPPFGGLTVTSQMKFNSSEWEHAWTALAANEIRQFSVVRDLTPPAA